MFFNQFYNLEPANCAFRYIPFFPQTHRLHPELFIFLATSLREGTLANSFCSFLKKVLFEYIYLIKYVCI